MIDIIKRIILFFLLILVQVLIFGRIHLFDCATPLLYVYFVLSFSQVYPRWVVLIWSFVLGLCIDAFSNTPGVATSSLTLLGFIQPYFLQMFVPDDAKDGFAPTIKNMGMLKFSFFAGTLLLLYCTVLFSIEAFNFFDWAQWLMCIGGSWLITYMLIITIESVRSR